MLLYNSLTKKLEHFKPLNTKKVTIYVCGITPYDTTHLGHAFTYISFDALIRYLKFQGYEVNYTQNVTDINDRDKDILQRAKEQNISWMKLAEFWTKKFLEDMAALNWIYPTNYLKASEQIESMIQIIKELMKNGFAYELNGSVYLDISRVKDFGKLSKLSKDQMLIKAKEFEEDLENTDKRNPLDITLWRASKPFDAKHIPSFNSPFGSGRPGWHIECSGMAISSLGETIDIHGGGKDLIYPHHESEIAQSEGATGKIPFAKYWLHTGTVFYKGILKAPLESDLSSSAYKGQKMSKSKGNLVMVSDLLKKYSANAIRWLLLSHHWMEDWEFKEEDLKKAENTITIVSSRLRSNNILRSERSESRSYLTEFSKLMDNNLDTPKALELLCNLAQKGDMDSNLTVAEIYQIMGFKSED